ncbi:DUF4201 domain-containing protein [Plasmodiophora brassicae]|uniref:DUF4201 domain-containing protein n=1 Tax=Plasmodiophora brassicae TaxID=37360 RepID=A0A0G4IHT3_PLABS|nr:hypothetical protein PBRA_000417 [Plasmodiophora brassicae]
MVLSDVTNVVDDHFLLRRLARRLSSQLADCRLQAEIDNLRERLARQRADHELDIRRLHVEHGRVLARKIVEPWPGFVTDLTDQRQAEHARAVNRSHLKRDERQHRHRSTMICKKVQESQHRSLELLRNQLETSIDMQSDAYNVVKARLNDAAAVVAKQEITILVLQKERIDVETAIAKAAGERQAVRDEIGSPDDVRSRLHAVKKAVSSRESDIVHTIRCRRVLYHGLDAMVRERDQLHDRLRNVIDLVQQWRLAKEVHVDSDVETLRQTATSAETT